LASAYSAGTPLSIEAIEGFAKEKLGQTLDVTQPKDVVDVIRKFVDSSSSPMLVMDRYPSTEEEANVFLDNFGEPKAVVYMDVDDEYLKSERQRIDGEDDFDEDKFASELERRKEARDAMLPVFEKKAAAAYTSILFDPVQSPEEISNEIRKRLLPQVYILVAPPAGMFDLRKHIVDAICKFKVEGAKASKFTVVDCMQICQPGRHGAAIEEALAKARFTAEKPDCLSVSLWAELFQEAFLQSPNPMGTFLVTNFPTPSCVGAGISIRDQFSLLNPISTVMGVMHVRLSDDAFAEAVAEEPSILNAYTDFTEKVAQNIELQYKPGEIHESVVEEVKSAEEVAKKVAAEFMDFREKREKRAS